MLRTLIYSASGPGAGAAVTAELLRLQTLYKKKFNKGLPVELYISSWGGALSESHPREMLGLTAYHGPEQAEDFTFLSTHVSISPQHPL